MMNQASFKVYYCGSSLESGKMDVRELAPALLSIGSVLEEANRVLNGKKTTVSVKVKKFEDGSFGISFDVVQSVTSQIVDMFSGDNATAAANIIVFLGFAYGGIKSVFYLIKKSKGEKPLKAKILEDGNVEIDFSEEKISVPKQVFDLYRDLKVRKEIENTLKPLEQEGINDFKIKDDKQLIESVNKEEAKYFHAPDTEDEKIEEADNIATYSIHTLSFKEDNKWRLTDGTSTFFVTIKDEDFLRKVRNNLISFSQGDLLKIELHVTTWQVNEGIKTEYEAMKILEYRSAAKQLKLDVE